MTHDDQIPRIESCDCSDPEEMFLWMLVGLPGVIGAPLILPVEQLRKISRHIYECGARLVEEPTKKFRMGSQDDPMLGGGGRWVDIDDTDADRDRVAEAVDKLKPQAQRALLAELRKRHPDDKTLAAMEGEL